MRETLTTKEVSEILGMSEQAVRIRMQRNLLPIGTVIPDSKGTRLVYIVSKAKLNKFLGKDTDVSNDTFNV